MNQPASGSLGGTKLVIIALCVALVAVVANYAYISRVQDKANESTFPVFLLTRTVGAGEKIQQKDVRQENVPMRFFDSMKAMGVMNKDDLDQRIAEADEFRRGAQTNALVTYSLFLDDLGTGNVRTPAPGRAWVTLPVSPRSTPPMLTPGVMKVDIAAPFNTGGARPDVMVVMENVQVVAVGNYMPSESHAPRPRSGSYDNITVDVSPAQALDLAAVELGVAGPFDIFIRNPNDTKAVQFNGGINPRVLDLVRGRGGRGGLHLSPNSGIFGNN